MGFEFLALQSVLDGWPRKAAELNGIGAFGSGAYERIHQILSHALSYDNLPNFADLAPLLRQVALQRQYEGSPAKLRVNLGEGWPDRQNWHQFGFSCQEGADHLTISPIEWRPDWLPIPGDYGEDIFSDCFKEIFVRSEGKIPIDSFVRELTGYDHYVCPGQKEALLSALFMPYGTSLIVNLPTGSGKTLVAQIPILMNGLQKGLTVFVVPTTALAIDQARRMKVLFERKIPRAQIPPLAWHGELSDFDRQTIKNNIRQGRQGVVFASPEAVTGALLPSIYSAAKQGLLKYLVVDEAHLVAQWGDLFRPAFQSLAGVRRGLLEVSQDPPFRTILMSATFSPETIETLDTLFGPAKDVQLVSAAHLRPEPRYWVASVSNENEKRQRLVELLKFVPRPFILYFTERIEANQWDETLRNEIGFGRIAVFTGSTSNKQREKIIQNWAENSLDGIVATSAFGVGVDKGDVRTVVHATVPESLDRFYQEVGRGGRDGKACVSVTVYSPTDVQIARGMSGDKSLGEEKAFSRWKAMFSNSKRSNPANELRTLNLSVLPHYLYRQTDFNESWNMRTLILMARAGLIELSSLPPENTEKMDGEEDVAYEQRIDAQWSEFYRNIPVRTLDDQHLKKTHFLQQVAQEQARNAQASQRSVETLLKALQGEIGMGVAIASIYKSQKRSREISITMVCRGCPARNRTVPPDELVYPMPVALGAENVIEFSIQDWARDFSAAYSTFLIHYPRGQKSLSPSMKRALEALLAHYGVCEIVAPSELWKDTPELESLCLRSDQGIVVRRDLETDLQTNSRLPLPRVSILLPWGDNPIPFEQEHLERPINVFIGPDDIKAGYDHKRFAEVYPNSMDIESFVQGATR